MLGYAVLKDMVKTYAPLLKNWEMAAFFRLLIIGEVILFQQLRLQSEDYGKHLLGVDDLIQKHSLLESDINVIGNRVETMTAEAQKYVDTEFPDVEGNS